MQTIYSDTRESGIPLIGKLPWGTRFCQFYQTEQDLLDILLPYFEAGLKNNEFCLCVVTGALSDKVRRGIKGIAGLGKPEANGRIEIVSGRRGGAGGKELSEVLAPRLDDAVSRGFDGMRFAVIASPGTRWDKLFAGDGESFAGRHNLIGYFAYPRDEFNTIALMEAVKDHRFALVRNSDRWEIIESSEVQIAKDALRKSEETLHSLFRHMSEGFAYHKMVFDSEGRPCDYVFLEVNEAFERLTGLERRKILGRGAIEVLPGLESDPADWIARYGSVAVTGKPLYFEDHSENLQKWYSVSAFSPQKGYFAVTFSDITERKEAEAELQASRRFLEIANRHNDLGPFLQEFVREVKSMTGCGAIGIRVLDGDGNIPYLAYEGFSRQFYESESPLSIKTDKCMCINVVNGASDPSMPFYTEGGSFYVNGTSRLLATISMEDKGEMRNVCNQTGYESVALIPIRAMTSIIGLVHIADRKENMVPLSRVRLLEQASRALGVGLQRAMAEEELHRQQEWLRVTLTSIGDAVIAADAAGRITFLNPVSVSFTGWRPEEAQGRPIQEVFRILNEVTGEPGEDIVSRVLTEDKVVTLANNTVLVTRDGREIPIEDSAAPIHDGEGNLVGVVLVFHDVTAKRRAQQALLKSRDEMEVRVEERTRELEQAYDNLLKETGERKRIETQLRQAQKMEALGTLTGGIAHDFNNILAAIIGFTEMVAEDLPQGSQEAHRLQNVLKAGMRGRDLVKQMLTFSRKTDMEKKPLRLSSITKETIKLLRASIPTTVRIEEAVRSESGLILADPTEIQQVLMNLGTNAAFAMREKGGTLRVELDECTLCEEGVPGAAPGRYLRLSVRDTGTGILPDIIDKIFDPFFTTKKRGEGTGLGLSVVHGIVRQSDGHITVDSEMGIGTEFTIYFPKILEEPPETATADAVLPRGTERILFVDDEELLAEVGKGLLERAGYEVVCTTSSVEALSLVRSNPSQFDLIITDQTMPDMTGVKLAEETLALRPDMPVILCTGFSHLVDAESARKAGIRAFVMKPLSKKEITRTVRDVLDGSK